MEKDILIGAFVGFSFGVVLTALFMKHKDTGTLMLRDKLGNIIGLLPMDGSYLETTVPSATPPEFSSQLPQSSIDLNNLQSKQYQ